MSPPLSACLDPLPPSRLAVGRGNTLLVRGHVRGIDRNADVWLSVDGTDVPVRARVTEAGGEGERFWAFADVPARRAPGRLSLALHVRRPDGSDAWEPLADVELVPADSPTGVSPPVPATRPQRGGRWVAVCLATHRPDPRLLRRQVESLRAQAHSDWIAVVSDDASGAPGRAEVQRAIGDDPRFHLLPPVPHAGAYGNFERALSAVPPWADAVAFCDQDDRWHPDKLSAMLARLDRRRPLVCCDGRVVDVRGRVMSASLWPAGMRRRADLASLLVANALPGCMSLWDAGLTELVLPFPHGVPELFHDQWVACVAAAAGGTSRMSSALVDYVQHGGNLFGHARTIDRATGAVPLRELRAAVRDPARRRALAASQIDAILRAELFARALRIRGVAFTASARRTVESFAGDGLAGRRAARHAMRAVRAAVDRGLPGVEITAARGVLAAELGLRMRRLAT
jgi:hypothetical protein